jgi:hypothetical protein
MDLPDETRPAVWKFNSAIGFNDPVFIPYENLGNQKKIEEAFRNKEPSVEIEIPGHGVYIVRFDFERDFHHQH